MFTMVIFNSKNEFTKCRETGRQLKIIDFLIFISYFESTFEYLNFDIVLKIILVKC